MCKLVSSSRDVASMTHCKCCIVSLRSQVGVQASRRVGARMSGLPLLASPADQSLSPVSRCRTRMTVFQINSAAAGRPGMAICCFSGAYPSHANLIRRQISSNTLLQNKSPQPGGPQGAGGQDLIKFSNGVCKKLALRRTKVAKHGNTCKMCLTIKLEGHFR